MTFPHVYLSSPAVVMPNTRVSNAEVLDSVRARYRGEPRQWKVIEAALRHIFRYCNSGYRYYEADPNVTVGEFASRSAHLCLQQNGLRADQLDMLIYGGIAREYFEPATAMQIASSVGAKSIHAFDITSACVGQLEAIHSAVAYMALYPKIRNVLVCAAELTRQFVTFDIQTARELTSKAAGLTIGHASTSFLVSRDPPPSGGLRLTGASTTALPEYWSLCTVPIDGTFTSNSTELFNLSVHAAPEMKRFLATLGWQPDDVDHYVFHQPSDTVIKKVLADLKQPESKGVLTHHDYANTASTTVSVAFGHLLKQQIVKTGHKIVLSAAAAGFTMVAVAGEWQAGRNE